MTGNATILSKQGDISLLRIIATLAVIFTHTNGTLIANPDLFVMPKRQTVFFTTAYSLFSWHVPVFFMITGALLLDRRRTITAGICVKKYAFRMLLALTVFGIPFALLIIVFQERMISVAALGHAVINTVNGKSLSHLWYLFTLIGIYLILPLLKRYMDGAERSEKGYLLLVLLGFDFVVPMLDKLLGMSIAFTVPLTYPLFYFLLGGYLAEEMPDWLSSKKLCAAVLIGVTAFKAISYVLLPESASFLNGYTSPLTALAACTVFALFKGLPFSERRTEQLWKWDRLCFGAYLIHPVFIQTAYRFFKTTPASFGAYIPMMLLFFVAFSAASFFASWIMSLIPPLKKYIL